MPTMILNETEHAKLADELNRNRRDKAFIYWKIGRQLNLEYGVPDGTHQVSTADRSKLTRVYGTDYGTLNRARNFARLADTVTEAMAVIADYGSWTRVCREYLVGLEPGEYTRPEQNNDRTGGSRGPQRSFNMHPEISERISERFGWTTDYTARKMSELVTRDRNYFFNIFEARLLREGFTPVYVPAQAVFSDAPVSA